jgi:ADP-ribose pyrophosphatase
MQKEPNDPVIIARRESCISPWATLVERRVMLDDTAPPQLFHSIRQSECAIVLGITPDGSISVVRQYRPVLERYTIELPSGAIDQGEAPDLAALRELAEEAGLAPAAAPQSLRFLGTFEADAARLEARLWCYVATDLIPVAGWHPEPGVESFLVARAELMMMIESGSFCVASHIAVLGLATMSGAWP